MAVFQFNLFCSKIPDDILQSVFERFEIENADHRALRSQEWKQEWEHVAHGDEREAELLTLFQQTNEFRGKRKQQCRMRRKICSRNQPSTPSAKSV